MDEFCSDLYELMRKRHKKTRRRKRERKLPDVVWHRIHLALIDLLPLVWIDYRPSYVTRATILVLLLSKPYYKLLRNNPYSDRWNDIFQHYAALEFPHFLVSLGSAHMSVAYVKYYCETFKKPPSTRFEGFLTSHLKENKMRKKLSFIFANCEPDSDLQKVIYRLFNWEVFDLWEEMDKSGWADKELLGKKLYFNAFPGESFYERDVSLPKIRKFKTLPAGYDEVIRERIYQAEKEIGSVERGLEKIGYKLVYEIVKEDD